MKIRYFSLALAFLVLVPASSLFAQKKSAAEVVQEFYAFHGAAVKDFNKSTIEARKKWFSDALYRLFLGELKREEEFVKKNPSEKPFFGDGLPFNPFDECTVGKNNYPNIFRVQSAEIENAAARVPVKFFQPQQCGGAEIVTYTVRLVRDGNRWLIDDWVYEDGKTLTADLRRQNY